MVSGKNEIYAVESLLVLNFVNDEKIEQNDKATNIYFDAVVPARKNKFFHRHMIELFYKLDLDEQNY